MLNTGAYLTDRSLRVGREEEEHDAFVREMVRWNSWNVLGAAQTDHWPSRFH